MVECNPLRLDVPTRETQQHSEAALRSQQSETGEAAPGPGNGRAPSELRGRRLSLSECLLNPSLPLLPSGLL